MALKCNWPSCRALRFNSKEDLVHHANRHVDSLIAASASEKIYCCTWPGCKRKSNPFNGSTPLKKHLKGHVKDHWCSHTNCNEAFARRYDLNRHVQSKHSEDRIYQCPDETCERHESGFARKDHLDRHKRRDHRNFRCTLYHCDSQVLECEMADHRNLEHGRYECSLPGCKSTTSRFTYNVARGHLRVHHQLDFDSFRLILEEAVQTPSGDETFEMKDIGFRVSPCTICTNGNAHGNGIITA